MSTAHVVWTRRTIIDRIESFRSLTQGWDGYGAPPITEDAIRAATGFVDKFHVAPMTDGGVSFEITFGDGYEFSVDFGPDGKVSSWLCAWDRPGEASG